tara:strand:+ start:336 stop:1106 length:771 start_codon:yes stop_codon:yes gene_type:complete
MTVSRKKITDYISTIGRVAQTSHYQVNFSGLNQNITLMNFLNRKGVDTSFISNEAGLLCSSASLPGSSLATANIDGNFQGVQEKMAHSRIYTQLDLEFYVDRDYKMIKLFDCWMDYIAGSAVTEGTEPISKASRNYYYRVSFPQGPDAYKCDRIEIKKFETDGIPNLRYVFYGMFPVSMTSIPVQYGNSDVLRMNVTFNYERYIKGSIDEKNRNDDLFMDELTGDDSKIPTTVLSQQYYTNMSREEKKSYDERYTY